MKVFVPSKARNYRTRTQSSGHFAHKRVLVRNGAVIPMMAIFLPVVILLAAISVNIAYLELNRTEMVIASDRVLNDFKVGISPQRFVHYQQENDK